VTDKSQEGLQFCKGFGGIGGTLRYKVAFEDMAVFEDDEDEVSSLALAFALPPPPPSLSEGAEWADRVCPRRACQQFMSDSDDE
jgi:hypothetical protein